MRSRQELALSALEGDCDGDTLAPLRAAPLQRVLTCGRRHARTESVSSEAMDFARLIRTLHSGSRFWAILTSNSLNPPSTTSMKSLELERRGARLSCHQTRSTSMLKEVIHTPQQNEYSTHNIEFTRFFSLHKRTVAVNRKGVGKGVAASIDISSFFLIL